MAVLRIGRGRPRVVGNEPVILVYFVSGDDRIFRWIGWGGGRIGDTWEPEVPFIELGKVEKGQVPWCAVLRSHMAMSVWL